MRIEPLAVDGALTLTIERLGDERGFFARVFDDKELAELGVDFHLRQSSVSFNAEQGTLRGMHYQAEPFPEAKIVRCDRGSIYDVIVDLRPDSPTRGRWAGVELSAENRTGLYVPPMCAHGFITLEPDTQVHYMMDQYFHPECSAAVRYDDARFGIEWPLSPAVISPKDREIPDFTAW